MAQRKVRAKDIKKQRWAGIVAAFLAIGMLVSLAGVFIGQTVRDRETILPGQQAEPEPEDYLAYYQGEVDRLESYLEEHQAGEAVILELIENYRYLSYIQQVFFDNQDILEVYKARQVSLINILIELEPENLQYRLELINLYLEKGDNQELIDEEVVFLMELLREKPDPLFHLSLIGLLASAGEEELVREEATWLYLYLEERVAEGLADNEELFYYAVLIGEYTENPDAAEEILNAILEQEDEDSIIYQDALDYLNYLRSESNDD